MKLRPVRLLIPFFMFIAAMSLSACENVSTYAPWSAPSSSLKTPKAIPQEARDMPISAQPESSAKTPLVKVAILLPLSGPHKALGEAMLKSAQMALFDVGTNTIELMPRDVGDSPKTAVSAANAAIGAGAQLILGPIFAPSVQAIKPVAQRAGLNVIAFSTDWKLAGGNTYIMGFMPFDQIERITRFAASQNIRNAGALIPANEYGRAVQTTFSRLAPQAGMRILATTPFPPEGQGLEEAVNTFTGQISQNMTMPEAVLLPTGGRPALTLARQLTLNGFPPDTLKRLGTGLFDEGAGESLLSRAQDLNGAWFPAPSPALRQKFEERYQGLYGENPPRLSTLAYDATALASILATKGLSENGAPAYNKAALTNPNGFSGIDGIFRFRENGTAERGLAILEFKNGQIVVIDEAPQSF